MDILGCLPLEIAHYVLSYLDAEEVGRCCFVCRHWRDIANSDHLWFKLCVSNGIDVNEENDLQIPDKNIYFGLPAQCKWGRIFSRYFSSLIKNWSSSSCERFEIPYREQTNAQVVPRINTDGSTIIFGDCNGVIDIWKIKKGRRSIPTLLQSITISQHTISKVLTNTEFFVAVVDTIYILVYQLQGLEYVLIAGFYTKAFPSVNGNVINRFVYKKESQSLYNFIEERRSTTLMVHTIGFFDSNLYLRTNLHSVFIWSLKPFVFCGEINFYDNDCAVTTYKDCLYVHYGSRIVVYDNRCVILKEYRVSDTIFCGNRYLSSLYCNNNLVSAIAGNYRDLKEVNRKLIIWDKRTCKELCQKVLLMYEYAFLHPKDDIVYIIHQSKSPKYVIKAWKPLEDSITWLALHSSELDSYHFSSVGWRFIVFFTHLDHNYYVFDSKTGTKSPLLINGNESSIIHYSNHSFILAETRSLRTFTIFSFIN